MKQVIKYTLSFLVTLVIGTSALQAQKIDSYVLVMPKYYLSEGGPIFIKSLTNLNSDNAVFGKKYAEALKRAFLVSNRGMQADVKNYNPWYTTQIYSLTDNESEANYIISGEYTISSGTSKDAKSHQTAETSSSNDPKIPFHFYEYSASANANVKGMLTVFQKSSDKIVLQMPFDKSENTTKSAYVEPVNMPAAGELVDKAGNNAINQYAYYLIPYFSVHKYKFENIRSDDKDYNKELRKLRSELKDLGDDGKVKELGAAYTAMLGKSIKNPEDLHFNIGQCYEIIGNFTKAKEHYDKSNDSDSKSRIETLTVYRDIYKSFGITVKEEDF